VAHHNATVEAGEEMNLLHGRTAMADDDLDLLRAMVQDMETYIEIGTLWGGSVITAALANEKLQCVCIDPFQGYYGGIDKWSEDSYPTFNKVLQNITAAGLSARIALVQGYSKPFPMPRGYQFDCGLIDGDHTPEMVKHDWGCLVEHGCKRIAAHDIDDPDVEQALWECVDDGWAVFGETERMRVYERIRA